MECPLNCVAVIASRIDPSSVATVPALTNLTVHHGKSNVGRRGTRGKRQDGRGRRQSIFSRRSRSQKYFQPSSQHSVCPWKGTASYYDVEVNGKRNAGAAWFYPEPKPAAKQIKDHVAFWKGVRVEK
jgi:hypothetical protein